MRNGEGDGFPGENVEVRRLGQAGGERSRGGAVAGRMVPKQCCLPLYSHHRI